MTNKEKADKLYQSFLSAWDNYTKIDQEYSKSSGFKELLSTPALKTAYQKWQAAVSDYYDFAKAIENKDLGEEYKGS